MSPERYQNPVLGNDITLRLYTYNSNNLADPTLVDSVDIYFLDKTLISDTNPDGRNLIASIYPPNIIRSNMGQYSVVFNLPSPTYVIGNYIDVWNIMISPVVSDVSAIENNFIIYPDLWYTDIKPVLYDFNFDVRPNKLRKGSKRFLIIGIHPNVPKASDMARYYENLATVSPIKIYIEMECVECMPPEQDLRLVVDGDPVEQRDLCAGYYQLDTTEMPCGIYNVWFEMEFGSNIYISDRNQLQIY